MTGSSVSSGVLEDACALLIQYFSATLDPTMAWVLYDFVISTLSKPPWADSNLTVDPAISAALSMVIPSVELLGRTAATNCTGFVEVLAILNLTSVDSILHHL